MDREGGRNFIYIGGAGISEDFKKLQKYKFCSFLDTILVERQAIPTR